MVCSAKLNAAKPLSGSSSLLSFLIYCPIKSQSLSVQVKDPNLNLCGLSWLRSPVLLYIDEVTVDKLLSLSKLLVYSYYNGGNSTYIVKKEINNKCQVHNIGPGTE